jgi:hypothetical protein
MSVMRLFSSLEILDGTALTAACLNAANFEIVVLPIILSWIGCSVSMSHKLRVATI